MEIPAKYNCTQLELYSGSRMVIRAAIRNIASFTALKPKYDSAFFTAALAEIAAAEALPDEDYRTSEVQAKRLVCQGRATECLNTWQLLKGYIEDAKDFSGPMEKVALNAAGAGKYAAASGFDWESVTGLMASGLLFITNNTLALTANNNMPATFADSFSTTADDIQLALSEFQDQEDLKREDTQKKLKANNDLYDKVIQLCKDGQRIFRNDEALRLQFVWEQVMYTVHGAGIAGLHGVVRDSVSNLVLPNALVLVDETGDSGLSDTDGIYRITGLPAGSYTVKCSATGYVASTVPFKVSQGTISELNFVLNPE